MDSPDSTPQAEMVAQHPRHRCPIRGERATLHCTSCDRVFCAEHVVRGFSLGYAFVCVECVAAAQEAQEAASGDE